MDERDISTATSERCGTAHHEIRSGWEFYKCLYALQEKLRTSNAGPELLNSTIPKVPKMRAVPVHTRETLNEGEASPIDKPYRSSLVALGLSVRCGVLPLRRLLMSTLIAKTALRVLIAARLSLEYFSYEEELFTAMKRSVRKAYMS